MFYDLSSFGWDANLSASQQTTALQDAIDSGELISFPRGTVVIDSPITISQPVHVVGRGGDVMGSIGAASIIRTGEADMPLLRLLPSAHNSYLAGFHLHADAPGGTGIEMGDGVTDHLRGVVLDRISTNASLKHGVHYLAASSCTIRDCWLRASDAVWRLENRIHADTGDNRALSTAFSAFGEDAKGLHWTSGGGLDVIGCKFGQGRNHVYMDWNAGSSGNARFIGGSYETCSGIAFDLRGEYLFKSFVISGMRFGVPSVCIAVRNFSSFNWLQDLLVTGVTADAWTAVPVFDIGCVQDARIEGNIIRGNGVATTGIYARNGTQAGPSIGTIGRNTIVGCTTPVTNAAGWAVD